MYNHTTHVHSLYTYPCRHTHSLIHFSKQQSPHDPIPLGPKQCRDPPFYYKNSFENKVIQPLIDTHLRTLDKDQATTFYTFYKQFVRTLKYPTNSHTRDKHNINKTPIK